MAEWKFYGRQEQLADLERIFGRDRWFFAKVTGRRRIGKTTLIGQAMAEVANRKPVFYLQIPDSESLGVLSAVRDALDTFRVPPERFPPPDSLLGFAKLLEALAEDGYILILDEFQYFNRPKLIEFCSHLQAVVDRLSAKAATVRGGLIVLGSIHNEMTALLEDRSAPLYNRVTDNIELTHLDIGSLLLLLRDHADASPERLLFLWNLFEGVPKFYRDCYEQGVLAAERRVLLEKMFFTDSASLRTEADNWFLRELRGRYDVALKLVARRPGQMHGDLVAAIQREGGAPDAQIGGYLQILIERYGLIERKLPIFAKPEARRSRYYLTDNFLRAWLAALVNPVSARAFRPLNELLNEADQRLADTEGGSLEKLAAQLYDERSRKGIGDFSLTHRVQGFWDKGGIEIDLVAMNGQEKIIRFGSCKRSAEKLLQDIGNFKSHVRRFLEAMPAYQTWRTQFVGIAPTLGADHRQILLRNEIIPQDLNDLTHGLV